MKSRNTSFIKKIVKMCAVPMAMLGFLVCAGCNSTTDDQITIVCTNFALYDWTSQLLGESEAEVILLLDNGTDMHSFQPSAEELIQIADCDMLVHVGGESDAWLEDALEVNPKEGRVVVNLMDVLEANLKEEVYTEGMQTEHVHADGSVCSEAHDHDEHLAGGNDEADDAVQDSHSAVMDEHVWLSLRMAVKSCEAIEEALCRVLPDDAERIQANAEAYCNELVALDQKYVDVVENNANEGMVIVADRFPFMYMMEDYGIEYYAAFPGCSTESEADFETVVFLAEKVQEYNVDILLITEGGTDTLANTVFENAKMTGEIAVLHSMQVVYNSDVEEGASYLGYMEANLEVLREVLK